MTQELSTPHLALHAVNISQELTFLIACCQTDPSKNDTEFIHSYLNNPHLDTNALVGLAHQHGILPLVYKTLKKLSQTNSHFNTNHDTLLPDLKSAYTQIAQRNMLMSAELIRIIKLLEYNGIEALAFKGPTLAQMAYGDITLRQYSDLDILVNEKDAYNAAELLVKHHFTPINSLNTLKNAICLDVGNDFSLLDAKNGIHIELHWRLFPKQFSSAFHNDQVFHSPNLITINNTPIKTLSPEVLLVYLCVHGSKHAWERIEWIYDIDRLISSQINIQWKEILFIADTMKSMRMLLLGVRLSYKLFQTNLPIEILHEIEKDKKLAHLFTMTMTLMGEELILKEGINHIKTIRKFQLLLLDTKIEKIKYILGKIFQVSSNDCTVFPLPLSLKFLYLFLRPFRLLRKYTAQYK